MNRAVFLDRDNTIIHNDGDLGDPQDVRLMKGAAAGIASLRGLGYKIVVVTNQGGVARGNYTEADVEAVHQRISEALKEQANGAVVDAYYFCPYHPEGTIARYKREHPWRKPQPGMLTQAASDLKLDLSMCWMIGDAPRDIEAGRAAGARTIMIHTDADPQQLSLDPTGQADFDAHNLVEAARVVAQHLKPEAAVEQGAAPEGSKSTYPAVQALGATRSSTTRDAGRQRPFKPWDIQPRTDDDEQQGEPARSTARMTQARSEGALPPQPVEPIRPVRTTPEPPPEKPVKPLAASIAPPAAPAQVDEPETTDDQPDIVSDRSSANVLRQILRELKQRHAAEGDWSLPKMLGLGIAQPFALFCALMALLNVNDAAHLQSWLTGGVFCQLLVVTLLLIHWQR